MNCDLAIDKSIVKHICIVAQLNCLFTFYNLLVHTAEGDFCNITKPYDSPTLRQPAQIPHPSPLFPTAKRHSFASSRSKAPDH